MTGMKGLEKMRVVSVTWEQQKSSVAAKHMHTYAAVCVWTGLCELGNNLGQDVNMSWAEGKEGQIKRN